MTSPDLGSEGLCRRQLLTIAPPRTHTIVVEKMKFGPAPTGVRVGDTVTWVNRDIGAEPRF